MLLPDFWGTQRISRRNFKLPKSAPKGRRARGRWKDLCDRCRHRDYNRPANRLRIGGITPDRGWNCRVIWECWLMSRNIVRILTITGYGAIWCNRKDCVSRGTIAIDAIERIGESRSIGKRLGGDRRPATKQKKRAGDQAKSSTSHHARRGPIASMIICCLY